MGEIYREGSLRGEFDLYDHSKHQIHNSYALPCSGRLMRSRPGDTI